MLGAIIGDIIGSVYEHNNVKTTDFELFTSRSTFTDDTIMTIGVAKWLLEEENHSEAGLTGILQQLGRDYPHRGYSGNFRRWIYSEHPQPYGSWGNGSAMRVSPVGLYAHSLAEALDLARTSAAITHNHSEGIKGAQAIAAAVYLAKEGLTKTYIKQYLEQKFGYNLNEPISGIRKHYSFDISCQGSVPQAITAFLEGNSFEEVIRLAISIGGDSDTIACMAGAIAACYYTVPEDITEQCRAKFSNHNDLLQTVDDFEGSFAYNSFEKMMPGVNPRAYWERSTYEATKVEQEEVFATFADMALRNHSLAALGAQYLYNKGAVEDTTRMLDMTLVLQSSFSELFYQIMDELGDEDRKTVNGRWKQELAGLPCKRNEDDMIDYVYYGERFNALIHFLYANSLTRKALCNYVSRQSRVKVAPTGYRPTFAPDKIMGLGYDEIFVFGSNLKGMHGGGAARVALKNFGAIMGQGVGLQGHSYAIPTMQGGVDTIRPYVHDFIEFAQKRRDLVFYVTRIGCGIAGFKDEEIAPFFTEAKLLENVILPKSFCEIMDARQNNIHKDVLTHAHGITKTLADILVELNKRQHFTNANDAMEALKQYFGRFLKGGDEIAFTTIRLLHCELNDADPDLFKNGVLDADALREKIFSRDRFANSYDKAYLSYCKERLCNLIAYLNAFRRYESAEQVWEDLHELKVTSFNHCGPIEPPYFFGIGDSWYTSYPLFFFRRGLQNNWEEISTDGRLDSKKMLEVMFNKHERGIRKYGLEAVIRHDYENDGPCHPEVYFPKKVGTGPIYVKVADRRYIRSCGEGKGPHRVANEYEFHLATQLLAKDKKYIFVSPYYIPKEDYTLPIYDMWQGAMQFGSDDEKAKFIKGILSGDKV